MAIDKRIWDTIHAFPKVDLHCHLDGSIRPETIMELALENDISMPYDNLNDLIFYMHCKNCTSLKDYLKRFDITLSVMQKPQAIERIAYEL
ncbi:MAG: adenosine deaminase, partial [Candidatus Marinimicrobia bacterium]|nr:adenosine deaminase [Candidatus Neomarinimicrobiota bacterium]